MSVAALIMHPVTQLPVGRIWLWDLAIPMDVFVLNELFVHYVPFFVVNDFAFLACRNCGIGAVIRRDAKLR